MKIRLFTITACLLLVVCLLAWVRSYVPGELHLRVDRGAVYLLCLHPQFVRGLDDPTFIDDLRSGLPNRNGKQFRFAGFELIRTRPLIWGWLVIGIPFWAICLVPAAGAAWGIARWRRQRERERPGVCRNCGYDLHGTVERCPECGTVPAAKDISHTEI